MRTCADTPRARGKCHMRAHAATCGKAPLGTKTPGPRPRRAWCCGRGCTSQRKVHFAGHWATHDVQALGRALAGRRLVVIDAKTADIRPRNDPFAGILLGN